MSENVKCLPIFKNKMLTIVFNCETHIKKLDNYDDSGEDVISSIEQFDDNYENIMMHADLSIPDEIFGQYIKQFPDIFSRANEYTTKTYIEYDYNQVKYMSTVYNHYFGVERKSKFVIKLSHNDFCYTKRKFLRSNISWHNKNSFYVLGYEVLNEMPNLKKFMDKNDLKLVFYYSIKHKRLDLNFYKDNIEYLLVTFENGLPQQDYQEYMFSSKD